MAIRDFVAKRPGSGIIKHKDYEKKTIVKGKFFIWIYPRRMSGKEKADRTGKPGRIDLRKDSIFRSAKFVQAI